jgi:hypothetical protein
MPTANSDSLDEFEKALLHAWEVLRSRTESPDRLMRSADPFKEHPGPVHTNSDVNQNSVEKSASVALEPRRSPQAGVENPQR